MHSFELARIRPERRFGSSNGGWALDAYPDTQQLDAGAEIVIADIEGPAVITCIHSTQNGTKPAHRLSLERQRLLSARGVVLEIRYDGAAHPSVCVPLGDFFGDGAGGRAMHFSTPFVEKAPESYNAFFPMPFAHSARVSLRNETAYDLANYSYVEWETLPEWDPSLGYFHAAWDRFAFQLSERTDRPFVHIEGAGHLVGQTWTVATDEPLFREFAFVMEGNNEVRIDGSETPAADYLGSEDAFGFSWGWPKTFNGLRNGIVYLQPAQPAIAAVHRFRPGNPIRFAKSLDWRVDWTHEFRDHEAFRRDLERRNAAGGAWVDYAAGWYWYRDRPTPLPAAPPHLEHRLPEVLRENPPL